MSETEKEQGKRCFKDDLAGTGRICLCFDCTLERRKKQSEQPQKESCGYWSECKGFDYPLCDFPGFGGRCFKAEGKCPKPQKEQQQPYSGPHDPMYDSPQQQPKDDKDSDPLEFLMTKLGPEDKKDSDKLLEMYGRLIATSNEVKAINQLEFMDYFLRQLNEHIRFYEKYLKDKVR